MTRGAKSFAAVALGVLLVVAGVYGWVDELSVSAVGLSFFAIGIRFHIPRSQYSHVGVRRFGQIRMLYSLCQPAFVPVINVRLSADEI